MQEDKNKLSNDTQSITPQCKVVVYPWTKDNITANMSDAELSESRRLDISSQITSFSYKKNMSAPTGTFSIQLTNSPNIQGSTGDWKDIIKRGSWIVIYMSRDSDLITKSSVVAPVEYTTKNFEAKYIRCIGYIDRVSVQSEIDDNGAFDVTYDISGRDFGVVYEDTTIWHDLFRFDEIILRDVNSSSFNALGSKPIDEMLKNLHDIFFDPDAVRGGNSNSNKSLTTVALQWLLPRALISDLDRRTLKSTFWGKLKTFNGSPTLCGVPTTNPTDFLSGNAWDQFKRLSCPELHELYTETDDNGFPQLIFRPIPFAINKSKYPRAGRNIMMYKDLPAIKLSAIDIFDFNLGEDNHSRYNSFLALIATELINTSDNVSYLQGTRFPYHNQNSIKRHGFRPMHVTVNSLIKNARTDGAGNPELAKEFNEVMVDYWQNAIFAESGTIRIVGRNDIKVGKAIEISQNTPYINGKRFYIEGYSDEFTVDDNGNTMWIQVLEVTRGFTQKDLEEKANFNERDTSFQQEGEFTPSSSGGKK